MSHAQLSSIIDQLNAISVATMSMRCRLAMLTRVFPSFQLHSPPLWWFLHLRERARWWLEWKSSSSGRRYKVDGKKVSTSSQLIESAPKSFTSLRDYHCSQRRAFTQHSLTKLWVRRMLNTRNWHTHRVRALQKRNRYTFSVVSHRREREKRARWCDNVTSL